MCYNISHVLFKYILQLICTVTTSHLTNHSIPNYLRLHQVCGHHHHHRRAFGASADCQDHLLRT